MTPTEAIKTARLSLGPADAGRRYVAEVVGSVIKVAAVMTKGPKDPIIVYVYDAASGQQIEPAPIDPTAFGRYVSCQRF